MNVRFAFRRPLARVERSPDPLGDTGEIELTMQARGRQREFMYVGGP